MTIIAHRCGPTPYLENSYVAAEYSLRHGADGVEADVRISKDHILYAFHDRDMSRVLHNKKTIAECTSQELDALGTDTYGHPTRIKTLLTYTQGKGILLLHIKELNNAIVHNLSTLYVKHTAHHVLFGVSTKHDLLLLQHVLPTAQFLGFIEHPDMSTVFTESSVKVIRLWDEWVTENRIHRIHKQSQKVWVMAGKAIESQGGICSKERFFDLERLEVDGILVNDPALFIK